MISNKGGKRPNAGRPIIADKAKSRTIRLTDDDWLKFKELGGLEWLRLILKNNKI